MNEYKVFVHMFKAMDEEYDKNPNEYLGDYLSDLNPFLFKGENSADPAEFEEFKEAYINYFGEKMPRDEDVYEFCKNYLEKNAPEGIVQYFLNTDKEDWIYSLSQE